MIIFSPAQFLEAPNCACVAFESDQPMVARTQLVTTSADSSVILTP